MAPEIQAVVRTTQTWLRSSWYVQVPFAWLEACVEWLQNETGGVGHLSQQQINQQALDQWLLTDLRDLDYPVLPEGLAQVQKTELSGTFCVQVDSLLDISQPAYGQLQKWKGTDCTNDEVTAVTQATQRSWEARPTRMLLLQVTDGVQNLEAMEYQPIPALSTALRPGAKLQLQGQMVCRLGMLLLGPSNVRVLGGEVEDLVDRNQQGRVLCRTLGLPEEQQQHEGEEAHLALQQGNQELVAQDLVERVQFGPVQDSGYRTLSETSTQSSRSSSVRSLVSAASSRSEASTRSYSSVFTQNSRDGSVQGHYHRNEPDQIPRDIQDHNMADDDFPDEDFDDLPLDELDSVIYQESTNIITQSDCTSENNTRITGNPINLDRVTKIEQHTLKGSGSCNNSRSITQKREDQASTTGPTVQSAKATSTPFFSPAASAPPRALEFVTNEESDFMDDDMDCFIEELDMCAVQTRRPGEPNQLLVQQGPSRNRESATNKTPLSNCRLNSESSTSETYRFSVFESSHNTPQEQSSSSHTRESDSTVPAITLTSPPFTYLCLLEELMSRHHPHATEICVKAFIVTLLGKLSSNNGIWRVCATISDGSDYLDVELSNEVLRSLLGFSVAEKGALKRDPARRGELEAGMKRCQEELVDMCCVMTIVVEPESGKAVVTKADPVNEKVLQELEKRVRDRRK